MTDQSSGRPAKRALIISTSWPPAKTGGANYALHYALELAARGVDVHVLTRRRAGVSESPPLTVLPAMPDWSWKRMGFINRLISSLRPDSIHLHFMGRIYDHHPMITFLPAVVRRYFPKISFFTIIEYAAGVKYQEWGTLVRLMHRWYARQYGWDDLTFDYGTILRDSTRVLALCSSHQAHLEERLPSIGDRCVLTPPPPLMTLTSKAKDVARTEGRARIGCSPQEFLFGYFGYVYPFKGLETLVKAACLLKAMESERKWNLALLGGAAEAYLLDLGRPDYLDELKQMISDHHLEDRIFWTGYLDSHSDEASCALHALDCCILPFDSGVHLNNSSFAAAVSHGVPVITTKGPNTDGQFHHDVNCLTANPYDAEGIARWMQHILNNRSTLRKVSQGGSEMAKNWFSWDRTMNAVSDSLLTDRNEK